MAIGWCAHVWRSNRILVLLPFVTSLSLVFRSVSGSGGVCSSALAEGECVQTQPSGPSCVSENPDEDCARSTEDPAALYDPRYAEGTGNCVSSPPETPRPSHAVARDLTVILYPIGRDKRFNLYVSWESSYDPNTSGFYVWTYKCTGHQCSFNNTGRPLHVLPYFDSGVSECLLINNANSRSVLYNGAIHKTKLLQCVDRRIYDAPKCYSPGIMTVVVIPWPRPSDTTIFHYLSTSLTIEWTDLDYCWATALNRNCSSPVVIKPVSDFNVTTSALPGGVMDVTITWIPSSGDVEYIVTVTDPAINAVPNCTSPGSNPPCFVARDTTQVTISRLDIVKEYSISVQAVPRCNGSSFAKHYVGCHSEECCQSKRIRHLSSNSSQPVFPASPPLTLSTPSTHTDQNWVTATSRRTTESSGTEFTTTPSTTSAWMAGRTGVSDSLETNSDLWTVYPTTSITQSVATIHSTMLPRSAGTSRTKAGRDLSGGMKVRGMIIGVTVAVLVVIFVSCAILVISFVVRRNRRRGSSNASSLTNSFESSTESGRYCNLMAIGHVTVSPNHALSYNEASADARSVQNSMMSSESRVSQATFEIESVIDGTESTCSEKLDGSLSLGQDDAFEMADKNKTNGSTPNCKFREPNTCVKQLPTQKTCERSRSESICIKSSRSSLKKRPRSFSTPHTLQDSHAPHTPLSALILYSKESPEEETKVIQQHLMHDLSLYNIETVSEDTSMVRECPASWLETQMREASAVFCVCNEAFDREWENKTDGLSGLVPVFKKLCHGLVTPSCGKNQLLHNKIAIVLPRSEDLLHVPTYINSRPKFLLLKEDLCKMARFVHGMPEFQNCIDN